MLWPAYSKVTNFQEPAKGEARKEVFFNLQKLVFPTIFKSKSEQMMAVLAKCVILYITKWFGITVTWAQVSAIITQNTDNKQTGLVPNGISKNFFFMRAYSCCSHSSAVALVP